MINTVITVETTHGVPRSFYFRRTYTISQIQEHWRECGQWWLNEPELFVYRVIAEKSLFELHFYPDRSQWILYRLED